MQTGTKISGAMHITAILAAVVGGPLFRSDEADALNVSEVSLISSAELAALAPSEAPSLQPAPAAPAQPETPETPPEPEVPLEPEQPASPEPPQPETPTPDPLPVEAEEAEAPNEAVGTTEVAEQGVIAEQENAGEVQPDRLAMAKPVPRPADRIADKVREAQEAAEAAKEEAAAIAEPVEEPKEETAEEKQDAVEESTTEIVTEADKPEETLAPVKSIRPRGRPTDIAKIIEELEKEEVEAPQEPEKAVVEAQDDQVARDIAAAVAAATQEAATEATETAASSGAAGGPLTQSEREGLIFKVQQCWNVPVAIQNAKDLKVTLRVSLDPDGHLKSSPLLIEPVNSPLVGVQHAYEAGRRALIRCQPFKLPSEKYETWKEIDIVFNPQKMVLK